MKLLVIGGTVFLGRHIVMASLEAGHAVTTFNRGTHTLDEQESVEKLIGDREGNLSRLSKRKWDAVIDTCGYLPATVEKSAKALKNSADQYVFISSISAYKGFPTYGMDETAKVKSIEDGDEAEYGSLKVGCELEVEKQFGAATTILRPGLIVGPHDPTDRFTYCPARVAEAGRVIAPGDPDRCIQFIDARDLAKWIVHLVENKTFGTFNATGPKEPLTMRKFLNECNAVGGNYAQFVWRSDEEILAAGVEPWMEMPLWLPSSDEEHRGFLSLNCTKAQKAGLSYTALATTVKETLKWNATRGSTLKLKAGLKAEHEKALLES